jgi:hypothetical protein
MNMRKTKPTLFKRGGKLSKNEIWRLGTEEIEVTNNIKYSMTTLDSRGKWK